MTALPQVFPVVPFPQQLGSGHQMHLIATAFVGDGDLGVLGTAVGQPGRQVMSSRFGF